MEIKRITLEDSIKLDKKIYIDARSPSEYNKDHVPDAINVPLLNDEERALIGKIYKKEGSVEARKKGVEVVSPKLQFLIDFLLEKTEKYENIIFYCSRGGLRSYSLASFYRLVSDKNCFIITKGYKEYRQYIIKYFNNFNKNFLVIDGFTGTGKTKILNILKSRGLPVIDLEFLAKHRGSVFGSVGINEKVNQKKFESLLYKECEILKDKALIIVEGESRFIGKCMLPNNFYEKMNKSPHIWLDTYDELRVKIIKEDYLKTCKNKEELISPLDGIKEFIGKKNVDLLKQEINNENYDFVIDFLLKNYYDKLYKKKRLPDDKFYRKIFFKDFSEAVELIESIYYELERKFKNF